jgi:hypothetical protein
MTSGDQRRESGPSGQRHESLAKIIIKPGEYMQLQKVHVAVLAALSGVGATQGVYAQEAAGGGLEEIVVTATRRE